MKLRELEEGASFSLEGMPELGAFRLIRKHAAGCTVRSLERRRRSFTSSEGPVEFDAPPRPEIWSAETLILDPRPDPRSDK